MLEMIQIAAPYETKGWRIARLLVWMVSDEITFDISIVPGNFHQNVSDVMLTNEPGAPYEVDGIVFLHNVLGKVITGPGPRTMQVGTGLMVNRSHQLNVAAVQGSAITH